jgi:hypothetical protein
MAPLTKTDASLILHISRQMPECLSDGGGVGAGPLRKVKDKVHRGEIPFCSQLFSVYPQIADLPRPCNLNDSQSLCLGYPMTPLPP